MSYRRKMQTTGAIRKVWKVVGYHKTQMIDYIPVYVHDTISTGISSGGTMYIDQVTLLFLEDVESHEHFKSPNDSKTEFVRQFSTLAEANLVD
jgi:hypothetical protein